jgi:hypothetical protein
LALVSAGGAALGASVFFGFSFSFSFSFGGGFTVLGVSLTTSFLGGS